jgi:hypothetical protein
VGGGRVVDKGVDVDGKGVSVKGVGDREGVSLAEAGDVDEVE